MESQSTSNTTSIDPMGKSGSELDANDPRNIESILQIIMLQDENNSEENEYIEMRDITDADFLQDFCADKCRDKTCLDVDFHLPPIYVSRRERDAWDIKAISESFAPVTRSSQAIDQVYAKRKYTHDLILEDSEKKMTELNTAIEEEIRSQSENLIMHINIIKRNVAYIFENIVNEDCDLNTALRKKMHSALSTLNRNRIDKIGEFYEILKKLERFRREKMILILRVSYYDMNKNMYILPLDIQKYFENKLTFLNQITLNNYHCFAELENKLKLHSDEDLRLWFQQLKFCHEMKRSEGAPCPCLPRKSVEIPIEVPGQFIDDILQKLELANIAYTYLQNVSRNFLYLFGHPIMGLYEKCIHELQVATTQLLESGYIDQHGVHIDDVVFHNHCLNFRIIPEDLKIVWISSIGTLITKLNNCLNNFTLAANLWGFYYERLQQLTNSYNQKQSTKTIKNDRAAFKKDSNINSLIDALRQESSEAKAVKAYDRIRKFLNGVAKMCATHYKDEITVVEKVVNLLTSNINIHVIEVTRFLQCYPPDPDVDPTIRRTREDSVEDTNETINIEDFLPNTYFVCQFSIQSVNNWLFGIHEILRTYTQTCKSEILKFVDLWMENERRKIRKRYEVRLAISNNRLQYINEDFLKIRMAELKFHSSRFEDHKLGLQTEMNELKMAKADFEVKCNRIMDEKYDDEISNAYANLKKVKKKREVLAIISTLNYVMITAKDVLKTLLADFTADQYRRYVQLKDMHLKYLNSIRLFSEDDNYAAREAKTLSSKIINLEKILKKEIAVILKSAENIRDGVIIRNNLKIEPVMNQLLKAKREFEFKEDITAKMKIFHGDIRSLVFSMKFDIRKLEGRVKTFMCTSKSTDNYGNPDFSEIFIRCFNELIEEILSVRDKLVVGGTEGEDLQMKKPPITLSNDSVVIAPTSNSGKSAGKFSKKGGKSKKTKSTTSSRKTNKSKKTISEPVRSSKTFKDYTYILFAIAPVEDETFISRLNCCIYNSYKEIQSKAMEFYGQHGELMNPNLIQPNFKRFIEEVLTKYKFYELQCQIGWMECANEFTSLVTSYQHFVENYYYDNSARYLELREQQLNNKFNEQMAHIDTEMHCLEGLYLKIHNRLKTMFGHPHLKTFLDLLNDYTREVEDYTVNSIIVLLEPYKEVLKMHCINTETLFVDMEETFRDIRNDEVLQNVKVELENQLIKKIESFQRKLENDVPDDLSEDYLFLEYNEGHLEQGVKNKLMEYKKKLSVPPRVKLSFSSITKSYQSCTLISDHPSTLHIEYMVEANYDNYEKLACELDGIKTRCRELHFKYKMMWTQDLERVKQLYKLKYDIPTLKS